jgi:hypothetical protein
MTVMGWFDLAYSIELISKNTALNYVARYGMYHLLYSLDEFKCPNVSTKIKQTNTHHHLPTKATDFLCPTSPYEMYYRKYQYHESMTFRRGETICGHPKLCGMSDTMRHKSSSIMGSFPPFKTMLLL